MRKRAGSALAAVLAAALLVSLDAHCAASQLPDHPANLHVLPKTLSTDSVFTLMLGIADGLGVECVYCHERATGNFSSADFAADTKPTKVTARAMLEMVGRLNGEVLAGMPNRSAFPIPVTCQTCHRGTTRPMPLEDTLERVIRNVGADSAVAVYERLRDKLFGRSVYDFTDRSLSALGQRLISESQLNDARVMLQLNVRHNPNSAFANYQLGRAYEGLGERALAIAQYQRVLVLMPGDPNALRHLRALVPPG